MKVLIGLITLSSLLTIVKAPANPFWYLAIGVTEWGHWLSLLSLGLALLSCRVSRRWGVASWLALAAAGLYLTPMLRAEWLAQKLPSEMKAVFGELTPREEIRAPFRPAPIKLMDLFRGISSPPIQRSTVVYATVNGQPLAMDLYQPARAETYLPVVLVIHGGSWHSGHRDELGDLNFYLAARGYLVASIDYRLAPAALFPAQRDDVFAAITYLKKHALEFGLNPGQIVLLGRSAGGQIALASAYAQKDPSVRGVIALYAPNDLIWGYAFPSNPLIMNSRRVIETYLGGPPAQRMEVYVAASPINYVSPNTVPTLMIHGDRDELVSVKHEERLSVKLDEYHRPYFFLRLPWATHGCDANFSGPCGQLSSYAIERFLVAVMPAAPKEMIARARGLSRRGV